MSPSTTAAIEGLKLLGSPPNIHIKISALTSYDPRPTPESLREVALICTECFGSLERFLAATSLSVACG